MLLQLQFHVLLSAVWATPLLADLGIGVGAASSFPTHQVRGVPSVTKPQVPQIQLESPGIGSPRGRLLHTLMGS